MPAQQTIFLLALISFFFLSFFNDRLENNYLRIYFTDFHKLYQMKAFWLQMIDLDRFSDISWDIAMATNFVKNGKLLSFVTLTFRNRMGYCYINVCINSVNDASI